MKLYASFDAFDFNTQKLIQFQVGIDTIIFFLSLLTVPDCIPELNPNYRTNFIIVFIHILKIIKTKMILTYAN